MIIQSRFQLPISRIPASRNVCACLLGTWDARIFTQKICIFITQSKYTPSKNFDKKTKLSEIKGSSTNFSLVSQRNFRYVQNQIFSESFFITNHKLPLQSIIMLSANKYEKTASNVTMWHISHTYTDRF